MPVVSITTRVSFFLIGMSRNERILPVPALLLWLDGGRQLEQFGTDFKLPACRRLLVDFKAHFALDRGEANHPTQIEEIGRLSHGKHVVSSQFMQGFRQPILL